MARRALIIGSQTRGLHGVETDVARMREALGAFGFDVATCDGPEATREGILEGYERLIRACREGDAAVVYYSGHGGIAVDSEPPPGEQGRAARTRRFLVPVDVDESTADDFRGILALELSLLQARLTAQTRNVTVILDCCHAARLSRSGLVPKALEKSWSTGLGAHLRRLRRNGIDASTVDVESNPHAVRLVAAGPSESAYEYTNELGECLGVFTESLCWLLEESRGQRVTWDAIGKRLREDVLALAVTQRCGVEGPRQRLVFETEEVSSNGVLSFFLERGRPWLRGGRLHGVAAGDVYSILPLAAQAPGAAELARATVTEVAASRSRVSLELRRDLDEIPDGAPAIPVSKCFRKRPVLVAAGGRQRQLLAAAVARSKYLYLAAESDAHRPLASVTVTDESIELRDPARELLLEPETVSPQGIATVIANLEVLARAQALRELRGGSGDSSLKIPFAVELGRVDAGVAQPLPASGGELSAGDAIYLKLENRGEELIYVSVFDVGIAGAITLLSASEPDGIEIFPGAEYWLGHRESLGLAGLVLGWPAAMPGQGPRTESLVVVVTDEPLDLRSLESTGMRKLERGTPASSRYAVTHLDFQLRQAAELCRATAEGPPAAGRTPRSRGRNASRRSPG